MCGIIGLVHKPGVGGFLTTAKSIFADLLYIDSLRGPDSTGMFMVSDGNKVLSLKQCAPPYILQKSREYVDIEKAGEKDGVFWVGHNRKATQGMINSDNAHPFRSGSIIMVHNGNFPAYKTHFDTEVDSEALCKYLDTHQKDLDYGLTDIKGAFAIVWYDMQKRSLFLYHNQDRPLFMAETHSSFVFASEAIFIKLAIDRNHGQFVKDPWEVPLNAIHEIKLADPSTIQQVYEFPKTNVVYQNWNNYSGHNPLVGEHSSFTTTKDKDPPKVKSKELTVCFLPMEKEDTNKGAVKITGLVWKPEIDEFKSKIGTYFLKGTTDEVVDHVMKVGVFKVNGHESKDHFWINTIVQPQYYKDFDNNPISSVELEFLYERIMCELCTNVFQEPVNIQQDLKDIVIKADFTDVIVSNDPPAYAHLCKDCVDKYTRGAFTEKNEYEILNKVMNSSSGIGIPN